MFLNDQETAVDLLYYEAIAKTVVKLIKQTPDAPITVGVHGDWGAGKSSVLKMTEAAFASDDRALCLWFNGWTFEGFEDAKTVVIETLVDELRRKRPNSEKVKAAAKKLFKRIDWLKMARKAGGLAFTAFTGIPTMDQLNSLIQAGHAIITNPVEALKGADIKKFAEEAGGLLKDAETEHLPTQIHEFRKEFDELIEAAGIDQLVVIVDDLDRCLPATAIATLEAIRLFLFVPKTAFVIGADEMMIEYAVRDHFPELPPSSGPVSYARNHLEKLIQVPFRIPALGFPETRMYVTLLLAESVLGSENDQFKAMLDEARAQLRRPWTSSGIDSNVVGKIFKNTVPPGVAEAVRISAQTAKLLAEGTRGNPRQIKRFLNSLMLRHAIAEERGLESDIQMPVLAKLMLAERFAPEVYDQLPRLVDGAGDGKPTALAAFEQQVLDESATTRSTVRTTQGGKPTAPTKSSSAPALSEEADFLTKSEWAARWAALQPPLKGVDLRPYLFIARDRRAYFSALGLSSHLETLADRLMGAAISVTAVKPELAKLSGTEPEHLFDAIQARILQGDSFANKPNGSDGLVALVEAFPALQRRLLNLMKELPVEKLGVWATSTWLTCLTDNTLKDELSAVLKGWADHTANAQLSKASALVLKMLAKGS